MARVDVTKTELVWPGKYDDDGTLKEVPRVGLPFQIIETVGESRAARAASKMAGVQASLFDVYEGKEGDTFDNGWKNKLIWGDNLLVTGSLLEKFAGKVDLIYIDPPFATGADFSFNTSIGESGDEVYKEQSIIEETAYRDTWGRGIDSYMNMLRSRLILLRDLLSSNGTLYLHCDWHVNSLLRIVLDEVFGANHMVNEIIWHYKTFQGQTHRYFARKHDTLFVYAKGSDFIYNEQFDTQLQDTIDAHRWAKYVDESGNIVGAKMPTQDSRFQRYLKKWTTKHGRDPGPDDIVFQVRGQPIDSVWEIKGLDPKSGEKLGYPTQKPEELLSRIVHASSHPGDLVADFFSGSGTTLAVAEKMGRRWIGCDLGRWAIHTTRKRLLEIKGLKPFELLNLGKYERQYWQGVTFGSLMGRSITKQALYEYLAFVLKLYGAQPISGMEHLHGKKGKSMVHIGAIDAPVTIDEVNDAIDECFRVKQSELHVLGWEWEMGLAGPNNDIRKGGPMHEIARGKGVKLVLLQIPREVMEQQVCSSADVHFFELAYLEAEINTPQKGSAQVALVDFVMPNSDLLPEEVRSQVNKWSDYIDYWAVDWDFRSDTFMQGWVAYRTRKDRKLPLVSDVHSYDESGHYRILLKVIDVFGNDTSQAFDVEV